MTEKLNIAPIFRNIKFYGTPEKHDCDKNAVGVTLNKPSVRYFPNYSGPHYVIDCGLCPDHTRLDSFPEWNRHDWKQWNRDLYDGHRNISFSSATEEKQYESERS